MTAPLLTDEGLHYTEKGEDKLIERCELQDEYCYKYTPEQYKQKEYLLRECANSYPDLCKGMIEVMVDFYLNHPEKLQTNMEKDTKFMGKIK